MQAIKFSKRNLSEKLKLGFPFGKEDNAIDGFKCTGVNVMQNEKDFTIFLEQSKYVIGLTEISVDKNAKDEDLLDWKRQAAYRSLLGAIQWAAQRTRPDCSYKSSRVATYSGKATGLNLKQLNDVAKQLKGTSGTGTKIPRLREGKNLRILGISDANLMREEEKRSQGGYWIFLEEEEAD